MDSKKPTTKKKPTIKPIIKKEAVKIKDTRIKIEFLKDHSAGFKAGQIKTLSPKDAKILIEKGLAKPCK